MRQYHAPKKIRSNFLSVWWYASFPHSAWSKANAFLAIEIMALSLCCCKTVVFRISAIGIYWVSSTCLPLLWLIVGVVALFFFTMQFSFVSGCICYMVLYIFFYIKSLDVNIGQNEVCGCRSKPPLTVPVVESLYRWNTPWLRPDVGCPDV